MRNVSGSGLRVHGGILYRFPARSVAVQVLGNATYAPPPSPCCSSGKTVPLTSKIDACGSTSPRASCPRRRDRARIAGWAPRSHARGSAQRPAQTPPALADAAHRRPATTQPPPPQTPTFRTGVNYVRVDVIVTDGAASRSAT